MKKFFIFLFMVLILFNIFNSFAFAEGEENQILEKPLEETTELNKHIVTINWILDTEGTSTEPPFEGTTLIGSYSFEATAGEMINMYPYLYDRVAGASPWQTGFINYNGIPCMISFTYGEGGKGINPYTGEPIDGYPFSFDPFSDLEMPDTDVDIWYIYVPYYEMPDIPENSLDKIVIYVNRPTGDINPIKQEYQAYEILHVGKAPNVQEDVTNDLTVGQNIMPDDIGFSYWISTADVWFNVIASMTDYFVLTETSTEGYYIVSLNPNMPSNEDTAKEIAHYLEEHIPENVVPKIVTADTPSYDNDPGYYLIISDINSNLILGTTNIAITEKAEYPKIVKTIAEQDVNSGIGEEVIFTVSTSFPQGSKTTAYFSDVMTNGLTFVEGSLTINVENYEFTYGQSLDGNAVNGFVITVPGEQIKELAAGEEGGVVTFSYRALVNSNALIGLNSPNRNSVRLDYSHFSQSATADTFVTGLTLLKYDLADSTKTPLPNAQFQLLDANKEPINLIVVRAGQEYRVAESNDEVGVVNGFITADSQIIIKGLDADLVYYLHEVIAPPGYNLVANDVQLNGLDGTSLLNDFSTIVEVSNSSGTLLPSTGGIGTTIFYVLGGILIIIACLILFIEKIKSFS